MNAEDAQQAELPKPCGKSSVCTAESTETDVLDLPGSAAPGLAANFTGDSILASPTKCLRSLLVTVLLGPDQQVQTLNQYKATWKRRHIPQSYLA